MRVVCDNCGARYNIADHKLKKEINRATCKKCGYRIIIPRPRPAAADSPPPTGDENTVITPPPSFGGESRIDAAALTGTTSGGAGVTSDLEALATGELPAASNLAVSSGPVVLVTKGDTYPAPEAPPVEATPMVTPVLGPEDGGGAPFPQPQEAPLSPPAGLEAEEEPTQQFYPSEAEPFESPLDQPTSPGLPPDGSAGGDSWPAPGLQFTGEGPAPDLSGNWVRDPLARELDPAMESPRQPSMDVGQRAGTGPLSAPGQPAAGAAPALGAAPAGLGAASPIRSFGDRPVGPLMGNPSPTTSGVMGAFPDEPTPMATPRVAPPGSGDFLARARLDAAPAPTVISARTNPAPHNLRNEMGLLLFAGAAGTLGLLAASSSNPSPSMAVVGQALGLAGCVCALSVALFSSFGSRPAMVPSLIAAILAVVGGGYVGQQNLARTSSPATSVQLTDPGAVPAATVVAQQGEGGDSELEPDASADGEEGGASEADGDAVADAASEPAAAPTPAPPAPRAAPAPARSAPAPAPAPARSTPPRAEPARRQAPPPPAAAPPPAPAREAREERSPPPSPSGGGVSALDKAPEAPAESGSDAAASRSLRDGPNAIEVDRALSSNTALHRCVRLEQASGNEVVGDVRISFYLSPNGTASRGRILTPRYVGSQMESCITDAISAMTFEPFEGRTQRMSWKFTVL